MRLRGKVAACALAAALLAGCGQSRPVAQSQTPTAAIPLCAAGDNGIGLAGPIAAGPPGPISHDYPWLASNLDLAAQGYIEREYFLCGTAPGGGYTTRLLVRRPADAAAFNGVVVVEWLNVTLGYDLDVLWQLSHDHLMKAGYAYVAVSAQREGLYDAGGLLAWSPVRYAQLAMPQGAALDQAFVFDPAAYVIYGQALRAIKSPGAVDPLGGLPRRHLIASGASQSAGTVTIYYDAFQAVDQVADGFFLQLLSFSSLLAALDHEQQANVDFPTLTAAIGKPVFLVNTETDPSYVRAPDSNRFRLWEAAGASHLDQEMIESLRPILLRDAGLDITATDGECQLAPRSRIPFRYVLNAALDHLAAWLDGGTPPPVGQPFQYDAQGNLQRDSYGNVLGGIRLSQEAVATAVNSRDNAPRNPDQDPLCELQGSYAPFSAAQLSALYPTHATYVSQVQQVTARNMSAGYIGADDAQATVAAAQDAAVPP